VPVSPRINISLINFPPRDARVRYWIRWGARSLGRGELIMEVLSRRCAGIDVSKRDAKVCVRIQGSGRRGTSSEVTTWGSTTGQILALRDYLSAAGVEAVVMESTGAYWKPLYYLLEDDLNLVLVNAREAKTVPGRKTDVADAAWLADLGAHGLVRASFVPPPPIRELRDLTRLRTTVLRDKAQEWQRLEKLLEDAQIKLSSVVSDLAGVSSRMILQAMIDGQTDPERLAQLARGKLKVKHDQLVEALTGRFSDHHRFLARLHLSRIDAHTADAAQLEAAIEQAMAPFQAAQELLCSIPGVNTVIADVIIAETGADMTVFPTAAHLCSWAGTSPGLHQSAGKNSPVATRHGNAHLKAALGMAAFNIARNNNTYLSARYRRLAARRGKKRAIVAIERAILTAIWHMLTDGAYYEDPGPDYYLKHNSARRASKALRELTRLGYKVTITKAA
jgi:transposase